MGYVYRSPPFVISVVNVGMVNMLAFNNDADSRLTFRVSFSLRPSLSTGRHLTVFKPRVIVQTPDGSITRPVHDGDEETVTKREAN